MQQLDSNGAPVGTPDHVTGSFSTQNCGGLGALTSSTVQTTCI